MSEADDLKEVLRLLAAAEETAARLQDDMLAYLIHIACVEASDRLRQAREEDQP